MDSLNGLESLVQRGRSALYNDLVSVFQRAFKSLREAPDASQTNTAANLLKTSFTEDLHKVVEVHMNIPLQKLVVVDSPEPNMEIGARIELIKSTKRSLRKYTFGSVIETVNKQYDDRTARLAGDSQEFQGIGFTLYIHSGVFTTRNDHASDLYTPEELAAVFIHELGHADYVIRIYRRAYVAIMDASGIVDYMKTIPPLDEIKQIAAALQHSDYIDKSWLPVMKSVNVYLNSKPNIIDPQYIETISALCVVAESRAAQYSLKEFNSLGGYNSAQKLLTSSKFITASYRLDEERNADDFSSRNGSYSALSSFLIKSEKIHKTMINNAEKFLMAESPLPLVRLLKFYKIKFDFFAETLSGGYDPIIRRLELISETAKHAFSDSRLPSSVKDDIRDQIKECDAYLKEYKASDISATREKIKTWRSNIGLFGRVLALPIRNRMRDDFFKLQESTRYLSRNPLYYHASK